MAKITPIDVIKGISGKYGNHYCPRKSVNICLNTL